MNYPGHQINYDNHHDELGQWLSVGLWLASKRQKPICHKHNFDIGVSLSGTVDQFATHANHCDK